MTGDAHPMWLPDEAFRAVGSRRVLLATDSHESVAGTVRDELRRATTRWGGSLDEGGTPSGHALVLTVDRALEDDEYVVERTDGATRVGAGSSSALLHGVHHVVRCGEGAFEGPDAVERQRPAQRLRMLDHWDNVDVHDGDGSGRAWVLGRLDLLRRGPGRDDLSRARGLRPAASGSVGINAGSA